MILRRIWKLLTIVAMLLAPSIGAAPAMAAMPMEGHAMAAGDSHCDQTDLTGDEDGKQSSNDCCTAICSAATIPPAMLMTSPHFDRSVVTSFGSGPHRNFIAALPTPPPRLG